VPYCKVVVALCGLQSELGFPSEALEPLNVGESVPPLPSPALPPYNGYGTLDDSKQNCIALVPKPPKKVRALEPRHSMHPASWCPACGWRWEHQ
jgi:hypothetical protein